MTETPTHERLEVVGRSWVSRERLRRDLAEISWSSNYEKTAYFASPASASDADGAVRAAIEALPDLGTGAAVFYGSRAAVAIAPPFPIDEELQCDGVDVGPMLDLLSREPTVGVVLLRLGRYAVGVLENGRLAASKSDTRYVKNRHRKGGSSQRRFERSRERLVRELYDKVCGRHRGRVPPIRRPDRVPAAWAESARPCSPSRSDAATSSGRASRSCPAGSRSTGPARPPSTPSTARYG